ncbi:MAG: hypothetical protein ACTSYI_09630 [Promethearchaeota archaeon]
MADSWDSIFKKQINIPEKESERKQSTLDSLNNSSKKQTLDEPINLSFLFDTPLEDFPSASENSDNTVTNGQQDYQRSLQSQRSFGDVYSSDSRSNRNKGDNSGMTHSKLPAIQWNQAKTHYNAKGKKLSNNSSHSSNANNSSNTNYSNNSEDREVKPKIISFGGNRALNNMYKRMQSRDQAKFIQNQFSARSLDDLSFQKLAARQNITADRFSENHGQFANSRDQKLGIPKLPNKKLSFPNFQSSNSNNSPYSNRSVSLEPKSPNLTPVMGLKSFQMDFSDQPSNSSNNMKNSPEKSDWLGYSSSMAANSPVQGNNSYSLSTPPIYSAQHNSNSPHRNDSNYGSLHETQQNLHNLRREVPHRENPYYHDSYASSQPMDSRMANTGPNYQQDLRSRLPYYQQHPEQSNNTQGFSNSYNSPRSAPSSYFPSNNYAAYGFQNQPGLNSASPYSNSQYIPPQHPSHYPPRNPSSRYGSMQGNFHQNSSSQFNTPNLESRLVPLHLRDQISPLNQIVMRQEESRVMRQVQDNPLSYPEPELSHLPANEDLRESLIIETLLDLPKSEPVKHEILQLLLANGSISEIILLRKIKKSGRYMGRVALGLIMFHLIEEFGSDMIQRKFSERSYSYSVTERFKEIVATAMKNF